MAVAFLAGIVGVIIWASLRASYESKCAACGDVIYEGDEIRQLDGDWIHAECAE